MNTPLALLPRLAAFIALAATGALHAATLVNDQFIDAGFTNGTDAQDAGWNAVANATPTIGAFNSSGNTSNALRLDTTATFSVTTGTFTNATPLSIGESITLSFDFRIIAPPVSDGAGLRFGLSSSANTYALTFGTGASSGAGLAQFGASTTSGTNTGYALTGSAFSINDTASHTFSLQITRTGSTSLSFVGTVDANTVSAVTSNSVSNFTFTNIVLGQGSAAFNDFNIDNVLVTTAIPEPSSTALLLGAGVLSAVLMARPKRPQSLR